ncbi:MAG: radical SAM protein, partial [Treponema sp.]|nr:radical SAM protein [Treponema sp.]
MSEGITINTGYVDPVNDLGALLLEVQKPARYSGGEYGRLARKDAPLQTLIAFPDLYEIGMSNQALRIIYNGLNRISGISCDRAFAPAPDFEGLLRDRGLPLYGLDTGISLKKLDLLLFTLGYELGISGILAMLDVSGIPLRTNQRGESDPLILAGGPAVSNPLPYSAFIDAFWIGEAEAGFFDLAQELLKIKEEGEGKAALFEHIKKHPHIWVKGKERAVRAVDFCFARQDTAHSEPEPAVYPVPSMKTVQHHGILEIMRGCPNGCRFCHAGYWYRPMRQKTPETLVREADAFISRGGYREISLSSLSSGDYAGIGDLVDTLNRRFSGRHVSFQLPSLRVSTFSLSLLEKISQTRKSGLTFAVETPREFWQLAINKQVTENSVVEILKEAKRNGWRGAKFYFMIGLPVPPLPEGAVYSEETEIVNFITTVARKTSMHFNINVGIFVPKPHTPYQWARQIDRESAAAKLDFIRSRLKPLGHKVSISDPLVSMLEGILSRGDERAGDLVEHAFRAGSRLDAWQEFIAKDAWQDILEKNAALTGEFLAAKNVDAPLPWRHIISGVSPAYL